MVLSMTTVFAFSVCMTSRFVLFLGLYILYTYARPTLLAIGYVGLAHSLCLCTCKCVEFCDADIHYLKPCM